jgi:hypothetical protein
MLENICVMLKILPNVHPNTYLLSIMFVQKVACERFILERMKQNLGDFIPSQI